MTGGAWAKGGQAGRRRLLLALALALALAFLTAIACVVLEIVLDPVDVRLPPELASEMVPCRLQPGERASGVDRGFYFDRFEVTVRDYREYLRATGRTMPKGATLWTDEWAGPGFMPATGVRLEDARAYAAWSGKRLPTSNEWDWAARGSAGFEYPWGEGFIETFANTVELGLGRPTTVGTFYNGRCRFGAYDLVGNVWEWTDSQAAGALEVKYILRGGSFLTSGVGAMDAPPAVGSPEASVAWTTVEGGGFADKPEGWANDVGFRCVAEFADVDRDLVLREELAKLGGQDPIRVLFQVGPAMRALSVPEASRLLERALAINREQLVRDRILDALRAGSR